MRGAGPGDGAAECPQAHILRERASGVMAGTDQMILSKCPSRLGRSALVAQARNVAYLWSGDHRKLGGTVGLKADLRRFCWPRSAFGPSLGGRGSATHARSCAAVSRPRAPRPARSEEHTSELQSLMRISYAVFCLKKKKTNTDKH